MAKINKDGSVRKTRTPRPVLIKDEEYFSQEEVFVEEALKQFREMLLVMYEEQTPLSLELLYDFSRCYNSGDIEELTKQIKTGSYEDVLLYK